MKNKVIIGLLSIVTLGLLVGCNSTKNSEKTNDDQNKLSVLTTFYPIYDFTKNIIGDEGEVKLMIPSGTEPHDFEPSAKDIAAIEDADIFVYHNENMESWAEKLENRLGKNGVNIIKGTQGMELMPGIVGGEHTHKFDPHTWNSPKMAIKEVESITKQLEGKYPKKAKIFEKNSQKYINNLRKLDNEFSEVLNNANIKEFVTQHAAFGYLARDYGLKQIPIAGLNPDQEPSASRLAELKKYVVDNKVKYIYFEEVNSDKFAKTLANEAGVQTAILNPLESLTQKQIDRGENYISIMKNNLISLKKTTNQLD